MEIGILMKSINTKYTKITIDVDDVGTDTINFGYLTIEFDTKLPINSFFMESQDMMILEAVRKFFAGRPNYRVEKEIYIEDNYIMINLARTADKALAPDIIQIVKLIEKEFDGKVC